MTRPFDPARERLRLLSTLHLAFAGISALLSLFPLLHVAIGIGFVTGALQSAESAPPSAFVGLLFLAFGVAFVLAGLTFSVLLGVAANSLGHARHWTFCMVMAGVSCAAFPIGTALGVFTILSLSREDVQRAFGRPLPAAAAAPQGS